MSSNLRLDCRKFAPNIFNKSKCTNCFRQKEEHSAEALESNRASRKVTKCGYLFVAPDWDFSVPLNRSKRWQRRWFVLYDDGELNYSVDEHPETVPQAVIDMNQVMEVSGAEDVTGHINSFAITAPDRVHFVRASCREEARWWTDVLTVFTRSKGRHKRNATFPGGQSTTILQSPTIRSGTPNPIRTRYSHIEDTENPTWPILINSKDVIPTRDTTPEKSASITAITTPIESRNVYKDQPASSASPPTRDKINTEEKARCRRVAAADRDKHLHVVTSSNSPAVVVKSRSPETPSSGTPATILSISTPNSTPRRCSSNLDNYSNSLKKQIFKPEHTNPALLDDFEQQTKRDEKLKDIADVLTRPRIRRPTPSPVPTSNSNPLIQQRPTRDDDNSKTTPERDNVRLSSEINSNRTNDVVDAVNEKMFRSDSDMYGGFVDLTQHNRYSPTSLRVDLPAEDVLNMKKGWLSKQARDLNWNRHWFVLKGPALTYFRDPNAEDRGIMDGVIDINGITDIQELQITRNFGFQLTLWDDSRISLSAVTSGIRNNWMTALRKAAGLPVETTSPVDESVDKEMNMSYSSSRPILFSSDEEYRTASEGSGVRGDRRESGGEWCDPLPPSPPLNRTPISRVKERARSRSSSGSRICSKRSRSSPPSSRRSTIDSVKTDELILPCCNDGETSTDNPLVEMLEGEVRELREKLECNHNLTNKIKQQKLEIEDLKAKLSEALKELSNTEVEVVRLKKITSESSIREKRMEELLLTLEKTERQLNERAEDMEMLKQMYSHDKELWEHKLSENESLLRDAAERCEILSNEVATGRQTIEQLEQELSQVSNRLSRGIDENEKLYKRIHDLENKSTSLKSTNRDRSRIVASLSDLTNIDKELNIYELSKERLIEEYEDLRTRFEKAVNEIRAMKKELRESHVTYDELELANIKLRQDMKLQMENDKAQLGLMAARIQDLTIKLTASDKQTRSLKQKLQDSREKRRSLSLKCGREAFSISKEVEDKLSELESKINALECPRSSSVPKALPTIEERKLRRVQARLRRKSLDSATSSEPMKVLIRLSTLENKVSSISEGDVVTTSTESISQIDASDSEISVKSDRLQALERITTTIRDKITECLCHVSLLKSARSERRSNDNTSALRSIENSLLEISQMLSDNNSECSTSSVSDSELSAINDSVRSVVKSMETLLCNKLIEIANRRMELRRNGQLTNKLLLQLLAEKLAYEAVVVERLYDAFSADKNSCNRIRKSEIMQTSHLLTNLKRKLNGKCIKRSYGSKTSIEYLTRFLTNKLVRSTRIASPKPDESLKVEDSRKAADNRMLQFLMDKRDEINVALDTYKTNQMDQLANALAAETLSFVSENCPTERIPLNDQRVREAWQKAQETVNNELVHSEISHVMMRSTQIYESSIDLTSAQNVFFSFNAWERTKLEHWIEEVERQLRKEMDANIKELQSLYEIKLDKMRQNISSWRTQIEQERTKNESAKLLLEFSDMIAHKALVDARIAVLSSDYKRSPEPFATEENDQEWNDLITSLSLDNDDGLIPSNVALDSEFQYLFNYFTDECKQIITTNLNCDVHVIPYLQEVTDMLQKIEQNLNKIENKNQEVHEEKLDDWFGIFRKCNDLHQRLNNLSLSQHCSQCAQLQNTVQRLNNDHEEKLKQLKKSQEEKLVELRAALENERTSQAQLRERARKLERRLGTLDSEYSQQVENLRAAYNKTLTTANNGLDRTLQGEENIRQRYQAEIEQLRALCEKGLLAMESSHRRIISELEDKHRREREQLRMEKESALAEETQATLAALDAMRKAHEAEVEREVAKFKAEFVKKMQLCPQPEQDFGAALHKQNEEEMEEIKQEILSLSEKYSVKCVESAALEEELAKVNSQLSQAQQHIMQLDARNKQLRAHLMSEVIDMDSKSGTQSPRNRPEMYRSSQSSSHGDVADIALISAINTNNGSRISWKTLSKNGSSTGLANVASITSNSRGNSPRREPRLAVRIQDPPALTIAELIRSPSKQKSCPMAEAAYRRRNSPLNSPCLIAGMVAERKKRFELH